MRNFDHFSNFERLFLPRDHLHWPEKSGLNTIWSGVYFFDNPAARQFRAHLWGSEQDIRYIIRETVEDAIRALSSVDFRSWMSDYDFMAKLLTADQLELYAPYFLKLTVLMPVTLKKSRRRIVGQFLENRLPVEERFIAKHSRKFIRSSVLLYPAKDIFKVATKFACHILEHRDQSVGANKLRISVMVHSLQLMSDEDLIKNYQSQSNYELHLRFLKNQCDYYRMSEEEIFALSLNSHSCELRPQI